MRDCIINIVHDRIPISRQQKGVLAKKKKKLKEASNKQIRKTPRKKKLLVQHGGNHSRHRLKHLNSVIIMSLTHWKKKFVVPSDTYEMIMERQSNTMEQPEKNDFISQMKK